MAFEEQLYAYKSTTKAKRYLIMIVIGVLGPAYYFYEEGSAVEQQVQQVESKESITRMKFAKAVQKKKKIPELKETLTETEEQLELATRVLPNEFYIDEILQSTAEFSRDLGVDIESFKPGKEVQPNKSIKYAELPIEVETQGNYSNIATFLDRLVHMDKLVHLRGIHFSDATLDKSSIENWNKLSPRQKSDKADINSTIKAKFAMVVFRGLP